MEDAGSNQPTQPQMTPPPVNQAPSFNQPQIVTPEPQVINTGTDTIPKKSSKAKVIIVIGLITLIAAAVAIYLFLIKPKDKLVEELYIPSYLPPGYSQLHKMMKLTGEGKITYGIEYGKNLDIYFSFGQTSSSSSECIKPEEGVETAISDYEDFLPEGATEGCVVILGKGTENEGKAYRWLKNNTKFTILLKDPSLSDEDILMVANSLQLQTTEIFTFPESNSTKI